ncbi:MAG: GNAT family N-acetyltransferase [Lacipirellulaceae bacterium]
MIQLQTELLAGRDALLAATDSWNDLWERSYARQSTVRAEGIAAWLKHFADGREFVGVCVHDEDRLIAALPLVVDRSVGFLRTYKLPVNCWGNAADLLIDRDVDIQSATAALVGAMQSLPSGIFSFEEISLGAPQWREFRQVLQDQRGRSYATALSPVGVIDIRGNWEAYEKSWSGNHRGAVKRKLRKLEKQGELRLERHRTNDEQLQRLLRVAFEIEDRSWKGSEGTSVLKVPGVFDYILDEARAVAQRGSLDVWFLYLNDQPIAFEYCHFARGTCFSHKIGYDPDFSKYGPGRLLRYLQLQEYHDDPDCQLFDMLGTLCHSKAKWATRTYESGRLIGSAGHPLTNAIISGYAWAAPKLRAIRGTTAEEAPKLGAESYLANSEAAEEAAVLEVL